MRARTERLRHLKNSIAEVAAEQAFAASRNGTVLIDIREPDEAAQGSPVSARRIVRGFLELKVEESIPDLATPVVVMCAGGTRSLFAADDLVRLGYRDVRSLAGGFNAWKRAGLPVEEPRTLGSEERERYGRHLAVPEVGEEGQARLIASRVLLIGAGGLGSPAAFYLAAAGVGTLGIVDDDIVNRSNLQRQILHTDDRIGTSKVDSARATLEALNPSVRIEGFRERLDASNVDRIFPGWDVIIDGTDNFPTRYLINDACVKHGIPNVHGSVYRFEGQVSVFWPGRPDDPGPCYRCLYPEPPPPELAPSCAEAGVLGVLPGVVGLLQSVETIKLLLEIGEPLVGKLLQYDALTSTFTPLRLDRDPECSHCSGRAPAPDYEQLAHACGIAPPASP